VSPEVDEIVVGRITSAYGIRGWVRVFSYTDPLEGILQYTPWTLVRGRQQQTIEIEAGRRQGKGLIARPAGFVDRDQAEALAGWEIVIDKAQLPPLGAGEYYWHELEGLGVVTASGDRLGVIDHLLETGAHDVLVIRADAGSVDDRERLVPFVLDDIVKRVDLEEGLVTVDWETDY